MLADRIKMKFERIIWYESLIRLFDIFVFEQSWFKLFGPCGRKGKRNPSVLLVFGSVR